jgi:hypothetical protein
MELDEIYNKIEYGGAIYMGRDGKEHVVWADPSTSKVVDPDNGVGGEIDTFKPEFPECLDGMLYKISSFHSHPSYVSENGNHVEIEPSTMHDGKPGDIENHKAAIERGSLRGNSYLFLPLIKKVMVYNSTGVQLTLTINQWQTIGL